MVVATRTLRHLKQILASSRFASLRPSYLADSPPSEVTQYQISYRGQLVETDAVALSRRLVPARLARLVSALNTLASGAPSRPQRGSGL